MFRSAVKRSPSAADIPGERSSQDDGPNPIRIAPQVMNGKLDGVSRGSKIHIQDPVVGRLELTVDVQLVSEELVAKLIDTSVHEDDVDAPKLAHRGLEAGALARPRCHIALVEEQVVRGLGAGERGGRRGAVQDGDAVGGRQGE